MADPAIDVRVKITNQSVIFIINAVLTKKLCH